MRQRDYEPKQMCERFWTLPFIVQQMHQQPLLLGLFPQYHFHQMRHVLDRHWNANMPLNQFFAGFPSLLAIFAIFTFLFIRSVSQICTSAVSNQPLS